MCSPVQTDVSHLTDASGASRNIDQLEAALESLLEEVPELLADVHTVDIQVNDGNLQE